MNQELSFVAMLSQILQLYLSEADKMRNNSTKPAEGASTQRKTKEKSENKNFLKVDDKPVLTLLNRDIIASSSRNCLPKKSKRQKHLTDDFQKEKKPQQKQEMKCFIQGTEYNYYITFYCQEKQLQINAKHIELRTQYEYRLNQFNCRKFYRVILRLTEQRLIKSAELDPQFLMQRLQELDLQSQYIFHIDPSELYLEINADQNFRIPNLKIQERKDIELSTADIRALFGLELLEKVKQSNPETFHFPRQEITQQTILSKLPIKSDRKRHNIAQEYRKLFSIQQNPIFSKPQPDDIFDTFKIGARLENGRLKDAFIFNITQTTIKITNQVFSENADNLIITGKGGAGKSMALIYYPTIFNKFIQPFLLLNDLSAVSQFKKLSCFRSLRKVFYISITQKLDQAYVFQCFNKQIQKHYRLQKTRVILQDYAFLLQIVKVYEKNQRKWKFVIIIDQINVYTSLLRRLEEQGNHVACKKISQFLEAVNGKFRLIYCSSNNLERSFGSTKPQSNYFQIFDRKRGEIGQLRIIFEQNPLPSHRFLGRLSTLSFQIRQRLHDKVDLANEKNMVIEKINALKQRVLNGNKPNSLANICCSITHKSINIYFKQQFQEAKMFIKKQINHHHFIEELMVRIRNYQMKYQQKQFGEFLQKGSQQLKYEKLYFLQLLEKHARFSLENSDDDTCCFQASGDDLIRLIRKNYFEEIFNRNIASFDQQKNKVTVYYSPSEFLHLTNGIKRSANIAKEIYFRVFKEISKDPSQYGKRVDHCFATIISTVKLNLKIKLSKDIIYSFKTYGGKSVFQHFSASEKQYQLKHKFRNILQKATKIGDSKIYFGAYPIIKHIRDLNIYDEQLYSYSSPTIDALLFQRVSLTKSKVITFDFTVATKADEFTQKYNGAKKFFANIKDKNQLFNQFKDYQFIHFIAVHQEFLEKSLGVKTTQKQTKKKCVQIIFVPLQKFQFNFNMCQLDLFTKLEYEFIMERFGKPAKQERARESHK